MCCGKMTGWSDDDVPYKKMVEGSKGAIKDEAAAKEMVKKNMEKAMKAAETENKCAADDKTEMVIDE